MPTRCRPTCRPASAGIELALSPREITQRAVRPGRDGLLRRAAPRRLPDRRPGRPAGARARRTAPAIASPTSSTRGSGCAPWCCASTQPHPFQRRDRADHACARRDARAAAASIRSRRSSCCWLLLAALAVARASRASCSPLGDAAARARPARRTRPGAGAGGAQLARTGRIWRDAVNALFERLGRSVRAQREFAGNVAHELRTPLAGIRALADYGLAQTTPAVWREQLRAHRRARRAPATWSTSCWRWRWPTKAAHRPAARAGAARPAGRAGRAAPPGARRCAGRRPGRARPRRSR